MSKYSRERRQLPRGGGPEARGHVLGGRKGWRWIRVGRCSGIPRLVPPRARFFRCRGRQRLLQPFATYAEALAFSRRTEGAEAPLALIRQLEYIDEPNPGEYRHVKEVRITEWPVEFLRRPRRMQNTIPDFLAPDAPANRLDILRGLASR